MSYAGERPTTPGFGVSFCPSFSEGVGPALGGDFSSTFGPGLIVTLGTALGVDFSPGFGADFIAALEGVGL